MKIIIYNLWIFFKKFFSFVKKDSLIYFSYKLNFLGNLILIFFIFSLLYFIPILDQNMNLTSSESKIGNALIALALIDFMFVCLSVFSSQIRMAQVQGTFEVLILTRTSIFTIILSSYGLTFFRSFIRLNLYILVSYLFFDLSINFSKVPLFILITFIGSVPFILLGMISASFVMVFKVGSIINFFISIVSIFLSGIFFPIDLLPEMFIKISELNPLQHSIDASQKILLRSATLIEIHEELFSIFYQILALLPFSIFVVYYSIKFSKKTGSLNHY